MPQVSTSVIRLFCWFGVAVLLLNLISCKSSPKQLPLPPQARVLAFGDSLTFGTGAMPEDSYPARLQAEIQHEVVNGGLPGETSSEGLKRLAIWLDEYEPRYLVLCHGANDFLRSLSEEKAAENIRAMVKIARDRGVDVMLIAVPKFGLKRPPPDFYEQIAEEFDIPVDKHILDDVARNSALMSDLVHPNAEGYGLIATAIARRMQKSGALAP